MNCANLLSSTGWDCVPAGEHSIRAVSPFTLGEDGQHAAFYIASPSENTFFLTDASETAMHAEHMGVVLTTRRFNSLNKTSGVSFAKFDTSGSIVASGNKEDLTNALWDAVKLAMSLSFRSDEWKPRYAQEKFRAIVFKELAAQLGAKRIIKEARISAASGNTIEFPIGVKRDDNNIVYVQPIALENDKFSWSVIYQAHGKFSDVKAASDIDNRVTILEDGASAAEMGRVTNFLSDTSNVYVLNQARNWSTVFV